ncbi:unnamed protein product [Schistosoma curassoni]|uniref:Alpha/beta hydrolase n=1 Tax=Schistosoma curassoni TaxID=6186 RepID=A0A183L4H3_9TREM|nr:unnamed protein product [Schistosoma curassoni]
MDENISNPIILIPGLGGAQAYCQLKQPKSNEFPIWLNLFYMMIPEKLRHYFGLYLNPITLNSENTDTCNVIFPGWGDTHTIEYLQTNGFRFFNYFGRLVNSLLHNKFFVKNFTLRGAPYDFRRLPCKCLSNRRFILIHSEYCTLSYEIKLQTGDVYYHN